MKEAALLPSAIAGRTRVIELVERNVERTFALKQGDLHLNTRVERIVWPRQVAMWLMRELTKMTFNQIGDHFRKDHGAAIWASQRVRETMEVYPLVKAELMALRERIEDERGAA